MSTIRTLEPLARHTTFRIGGPAAVFAEPQTPEEAVRIAEDCRAKDTPLRALGNGSNLLVSDTGVDGVVLSTAGLRELRRDGVRLICGAGVPLSSACVLAQREGLTGLAFAYGIPGTVGGAVLMNAGAYGGEMAQVIESVEFWEDGEVRTLGASELELSYRHSRFSHGHALILRAVLRLTPGDPAAILAEMQELMGRRRDKQPLELPSAGSTFKRPAGAFAAALIDQCGLKGLRVGGAMVSEKHAGFVVNAGGATCADVLALMRQVRGVVQEKTGYLLEPEVEFWGNEAEEWTF